MKRQSAHLALVVILVAVSGCTSSILSVNQWASTLEWNGRDSIELPLTLDSRGRPTITVQVSGADVVALVDSGAPITNIGASAAERFNLKTSGRKGRKYLDDALKVQLGAASIEVLTALVREGAGITQLSLGQEIFSKAIVEMDFEAGRFVLIHPNAFSAPAVPAVRVGRTYTRPDVHVQLPTAKRSICATIDTGFDSGLALPPKLVKELALPADPGGRRVVYSGFSRQRVEAEALEPIKELTFGGQSIRDIPVVGVVPNEDGGCDALLGMAVLSRYRLVFDMRNDRMWLLPRGSER